jgi:class 3 adenylate cyclase
MPLWTGQPLAYPTVQKTGAAAFCPPTAALIGAVLSLLTEIIEPLIPKFSGHIVNSTGERVLSEFDSVVEATRCAAALRDAVLERNRMGGRRGWRLGRCSVRVKRRLRHV